MSHDVEMHIDIVCAVAFGQLSLNVLAFVENELMQQLRVLAVIASPVIGELKAGEMVRTVIDRTGNAQGLVRITAEDAKRDQNITVGD
jgi:hypothetical protein